MFKGSIVAIVTPFNNGAVDEQKLRELVDFQIENGTDGIVACGTTGESSTLDYEEHMDVIRIVFEQARGRVPVIAGTGSNSTAEAIELTQKAKDMGVAGVLLVTPYYNKPTQEGLYRHFEAVAKSTKLPIILYNVFSGDDFITFPMMACGAVGVISVLANIMPKTVGDLTDAFFAGDLAKARQLHLDTLKIGNAMFIESNPIPVKTALGLMGKCSDEVRLPLCPMGAGNKEKLAAIMKEYKLI